MNYKRIYSEFIADRKRKTVSGYAENHHITPVSLGGGDEKENIIRLGAGDHYHAHLLLAKIHGGTQWAGVWAMASMMKNRRKLTAYTKRKMVGVSRERLADMHKGEKNVNYCGEIFTWINEHTGKVIIGTRHDLGVNTLEDCIKDYFRDVTLTTKSGWFTADRYPSIEAVKQARIERRETAQKKASAMSTLKNTGAGNHKSTPVICVETGVIYSTQRKAADMTGALQAKISEVCNGNRKRAGGYHWKFA